jgi:mRNA interferase RelE/StbE
MSEPKWRVLISQRAKRMLRRLPKPLKQRLAQTFDDLAHNPRPPGCKKLSGGDQLYRVRVGDWRVIYAIEDEQLIVLIITLGPRQDVYRNL